MIALQAFATIQGFEEGALVPIVAVPRHCLLCTLQYMRGVSEKRGQVL